MVKTLRITTILMAIAALGFIIFIAAKGIAADKDIEKFLAAPGIAAQLQAGSAGKKASDDIEQDTPLIRQTKQFALRINPPPPPEPVRKELPPEEAPRPKVTVTAKFTLVGTSYHIGDEANSWALINEVGRGWHWVKQGDKVSHLIIEKIGDGVVLIRDGSSTYKLTAERQQKPDYVKSFTGMVTSNKAPLDWQRAENAITENAITENVVTQAKPQEQSPVSSTENAETNMPAIPQVTKEPEVTKEPKVTKEDIQGNIEWIKQLQKNPELLGMTTEEANELQGLGDTLQTLETELKNLESNEPNVANEPNAADEPDSTKVEDGNGVKDVNEKQSPQAIGHDQKQQEQHNLAPRIRRRK